MLSFYYLNIVVTFGEEKEVFKYKSAICFQIFWSDSGFEEQWVYFFFMQQIQTAVGESLLSLLCTVVLCSV